MGQKVTLGGQRLGAGGDRIKQELHNYERSTHDLSESIVTSMSCGTLTPFMVKPVLRGDVFEIETNAACRTIPTKGPLFGSYKLQGDFFFIPVRLYQALLHNNPTDIAQKMNQVMLPSLTISTKRGADEDKVRFGGFNLSSLMKYTGMSGLGRSVDENHNTMTRAMQCVPQLGYYDIYKNFYANKQEEEGKVITIENVITKSFTNETLNSDVYFVNSLGFEPFNDEDNLEAGFDALEYKKGTSITIETNNEELFNSLNGARIHLTYDGGNQDIYTTIEKFVKANNLEIIKNTNNGGVFKYAYEIKNVKGEPIVYDYKNINTIYISYKTLHIYPKSNSLAIKSFPLKNLDDMRYALLTHHELGKPFKIGDDVNINDWNKNSGESRDGLPYSTLFATDYEGKTANKYPMNGLCLKTYQNDIYNTWLNSEIIDGEGGVNDLTKVQVQDGAFMINALLYAEKLYELYNRIATTDGTYDSWLNVVYEQEDRISHEKPLYLGGFYNEIVFEEIVQSAPAEGNPLGELGGKGTLADKTKGGKVVFKAGEIGFIMGIVSITPRIYYTQQNEFYMTDIKSMDDFHKPALDQIGFQDLIGERLCFEDTIITDDTITHRSKIGKLPAWLEYQTSVDKAYGDLAEPKGNGYMILNRNYEVDEEGIIDATTYVDPTKYNYAFAYNALDSQNFWVQTRSKLIARRKMSANLLPNI